MGYIERVWFKAWAETKDVWTSNRLWLSIASPVSAILLLAYRSGWSALVNAQDVLINGTGGAGIAFLGTLVISILRSPKLLDKERALEISEHAKTIEGLRSQIEAAKRNPAQEQLFLEISSALEELGIEGREDLKFLHRNGALSFGIYNPPLPFPGTIQRFKQNLRRAVELRLVTMRTQGPPGNIEYVYEIAPEIKPFIQELLYRQ